MPRVSEVLRCLGVFAFSVVLSAFTSAIAAQPVTKSGYSFCQVDDVIGSRTFWVSPVFEFRYIADSPTGFLQRSQELATDFHAAVAGQGGSGNKDCYAPSDTRAEAESNREQTRAIITKKFMGVFGNTWKEVAWAPKPWDATTATAASQQPRAKYFYCYASDMHHTVRKTVASRVFEQTVPGGDLSAPYTLAAAYRVEFARAVAMPQGVDANAICDIKDTRAEAEKSLGDIRGLFSGFNLSFVDIAWTPSAAAAAPETRRAAPANNNAATANTMSGNDRLGTQLDAITPALALGLGLSQPQGALIIAIEPDSTAEKAGLKPLDVIVEIAGQTIQNATDVQTIVARMRADYRMPMRIWRDRALLDMNVDI